MQSNDMRGRSGDTQERTSRSTTANAAEVRGSADVSIETFQEKLRPVGEFVDVRDLGQVWKPRDVNNDWKPYSNGRWIFNQKVGWYFESDEPWAEITYHYGRWYDDPDQGWVWVADTEWAPAWVEWRRSKQYVGWRPLPPKNAPRVTTTRTTETRTTRRRGGSVTTEEWVFVPAERITSERITTVMIDEPRVTTIYEQTGPIGRGERREGISVNFAIDPVVLERESNVRIESRNLPRAENAPVPQQVRSISTEARPTINTEKPAGGATTGAASTEQGGTKATTDTATGAASRTTAAPEEAGKNQASGDATKQGDQLKPPTQPKSQAAAPASGDAGKADPAKADAAKADAAKSEAAKIDSSKTDASKADASKADAAKADTKAEPRKTEASRSDADRADANKNAGTGQKRLPNENAAAPAENSRPGEASAKPPSEPKRNAAGGSAGERNATESADQARPRNPGNGQAENRDSARSRGQSAGQSNSDETTGTPSPRKTQPSSAQGPAAENARSGGSAARSGEAGGAAKQGVKKLPPGGGDQSE